MTSFRQKVALIFAGIVVTFLLLEFCLWLAGALILAGQEFRNTSRFQDGHSFRILCIGESTTQGQYPAYLEKILNSQNLGIHFKVIDKGVGGINTSMILSEFDKNLKIYQPDMVLAMIGVNDGAVHMPPEEAPASSRAVRFLRNLKCYKLLRLLELHIRAKFGEWKHPPSAYDKNEKDIELGLVYKGQGKIDLAKRQFLKVLQRDPCNAKACMNIIWMTQDAAMGKRLLSQVSAALIEAVKTNPNSDEILWKYGEFGTYLLGWYSNYDEAINIFKQIIALRPKSDQAYLWLGKCYYRQGNFQLAREAYEQALTLNDKNRNIYENFSILLRDAGCFEEAEGYIKKANDLAPHRLHPATVKNYRSIKEMASKKNIRLVCIQYPLRPIAILQELFPEGDVIFVDNENVFKKALATGRYADYFRDSFAGDFGHCTHKGNMLLAENIARVVIKEVSSVSPKHPSEGQARL